jgi:hypothetical protein
MFHHRSTDSVLQSTTEVLGRSRGWNEGSTIYLPQVEASDVLRIMTTCPRLEVFVHDLFLGTEPKESAIPGHPTPSPPPPLVLGAFGETQVVWIHIQTYSNHDLLSVLEI